MSPKEVYVAIGYLIQTNTASLWRKARRESFQSRRVDKDRKKKK